MFRLLFIRFSFDLRLNCALNSVNRIKIQLIMMIEKRRERSSMLYHERIQMEIENKYSKLLHTHMNTCACTHLTVRIPNDSLQFSNTAVFLGSFVLVSSDFKR